MTYDRALDERIFRCLHEDLFEDVIDRSTTELPDTFMPSAKMVALGHDLLLSLVHPWYQQRYQQIARSPTNRRAWPRTHLCKKYLILLP